MTAQQLGNARLKPTTGAFECSPAQVFLLGRLAPTAGEIIRLHGGG